MKRLSLLLMTAGVMATVVVSLPRTPASKPAAISHQPIPESGTDPPTSTSSAPPTRVTTPVATTAVTEPNPVLSSPVQPNPTVLETPTTAVVHTASAAAVPSLAKMPPAETGTLAQVIPKPWKSPVTVAPVVVGAFLGCPGNIVALIQKSFGAVWQWAVRIAMRESTCVPTAANPRSTARGIMQMEVPLHAAQFTAVGCSWTQWANAACNIAAAGLLYREVGPSPWNL